MPTATLPWAVAGLLACAGSVARAAGGHFDVDDASVLDPGRCLVEGWWLRAPTAAADATHLGTACRVGAVELGFNLDRARAPDAGRSGAGPQLKWVASPLAGFSAGVAYSASFDLDHRGAPVQTLYLPFTWRTADPVWMHANVGLDRDAPGNRTRRLGASVEWSTSERWTVIAERARIAAVWSSRLGARFSLNPSSSIDLSVARAGTDAGRLWGVGLNHEFAR